MSQMYQITFRESFSGNTRYTNVFVEADDMAQVQAYAQEQLADYYNSVTAREDNPEEYEDETEEDMIGVTIPDEHGYIYHPDGSACVKIVSLKLTSTLPPLPTYDNISTKPEPENKPIGLIHLRIRRLEGLPREQKEFSVFSSLHTAIVHASGVGEEMARRVASLGWKTVLTSIFQEPTQLDALFPPHDGDPLSRHVVLAIEITPRENPDYTLDTYRIIGPVDLDKLISR